MDVEHRPFVDFVIDEGSTVIVCLGRDDLVPVVISPGKVTQTRYGALNHSDLVGVRFGSRVNLARGFVHVLPFTPELWTLALPHRTQVLYAPDISLIITMLDLVPGSIVAEAGTGSGSLTHALARAVYPCGRVYTFDFHKERVRRAEEEFKRHHLSNIVICQQRDVVSDGFGLLSIAQAAVLDLPNPWEVVPKLKGSLKHSGARVCFFSPCIEQVQRTCAALNEAGCFTSISTLEVSRRRTELCRSKMPVANVGQSSALHFLNVMKTKGENTFSDNAVDCELVEEPQRCQKEHRCAASGSQDEAPEAFVVDVVQPSRFTGHTGYLTFASYVSDMD